MKGSTLIKLFLVILFTLFCVFTASFFLSPPQDQMKKAEESSLNLRGQPYYESYCAQCHGSLGRGDGPSALTLSKYLPNFLSQKASFVNGFTEDGLYKTLNEGIPNSQMPQFEYLPKEVKKDIIDYLIYLRQNKQEK